MSKSNPPIDVLDCGCGDAFQLSRQLQGLSVSSFTGYDMSEQALELARKNFRDHAQPVILKNGAMQDLILEENKSFDVIYSSFAIHHLQDEGKKNFLKSCFNRLKAGGKIILIDILRSKEETISEYLEKYIDIINTTWDAISASDKELIFDHMRNYDFPAVIDDFSDWVTETGFTISKRFDANPLNIMLIAQKN
ncbi:MAG: class I SAM-dependent methyltransferase [Balneolaceae bacterium]